MQRLSEAWCARVAALVLACAPAAAAAGETPQLLAALEAAPASVVAEVLETRQLDVHGYQARLRVETALVGGASPGTELSIGWEELAPSRAPRFAGGDRVLLALEPLSGASIWQKRIPGPAARSRTLGVAQRGSAYLRDPSLGSLTLLQHYLALSAELRSGPTGVAHLTRLAASGELPLASGALERLAGIAALDAALDETAARALVAALLRLDAPAEFAESLLELIAARELETLRAPLEALRQAAAPSPLVVLALAALDGGLTPAHARSLLDADAPVEQRRAAVRWASGLDAPELLARVAREDPDPEVRSRAVTRLVALEGERALSRASAGLYDPDATVRVATATSLASLGPVSVPELRAVVESGEPDAARAAVAGLMLTGTREGSAALGEIAESHADPTIRKLARIALGEDIGHQH